MSDRERWIVYPMLFFAVAMGVKQNMLQNMTASFRQIECTSLKIKSFDGSRKLVEVGGGRNRTGANVGHLFVYGADQRRPVLALGADRGGELGLVLASGGVAFESFQGQRRAQIDAAPNNSGRMLAFGANQRVVASIGADTKGNEGVILGVRADDTVSFCIAGTPRGGILQLTGGSGQPTFFLGPHENFPFTGLYGFEARGTPLMNPQSNFMWGSPLPVTNRKVELKPSDLELEPEEKRPLPVEVEEVIGPQQKD